MQSSSAPCILITVEESEGEKGGAIRVEDGRAMLGTGWLVGQVAGYGAKARWRVRGSMSRVSEACVRVLQGGRTRTYIWRWVEVSVWGKGEGYGGHVAREGIFLREQRHFLVGESGQVLSGLSALTPLFCMQQAPATPLPHNAIDCV